MPSQTRQASCLVMLRSLCFSPPTYTIRCMKGRLCLSLVCILHKVESFFAQLLLTAYRSRKRSQQHAALPFVSPRPLLIGDRAVVRLFRCMQGALPGLVAILNRFVPYPGPPSSGASTVRRAADAITNLAHENISIKSRVRTEGGIPPLVALLGSYDAKVTNPASRV